LAENTYASGAYGGLCQNSTCISSQTFFLADEVWRLEPSRAQFRYLWIGRPSEPTAIRASFEWKSPRPA